MSTPTSDTTPPAPDFRIKSNDTLPVIQARLGFEGTATGPNLVDAHVDFIMRPYLGGPVKVNRHATIVSASTRTVQYQWRPGDTSTPGLYYAEWEVHDSAGQVQTFPVGSYHVIMILADLDSDDTEASV